MFEDEDDSLDGNLSKDIESFELYFQGSDLGFMDADRIEAVIDHYLISSQYKKAIRCAEYALTIFSFEPLFHLRLAQGLSASGKLNEALNILNALDKTPGHACEIHLTKGAIFSQLKDSKRAIRHFQAALDSAQDEDKDEIYLDLAMEYENNDEMEKAIEVLKMAVKDNPLNEGALYELAYCYDRSGETEKAIQSYSDFIDENPYSYTSWYNLGNAYAKKEMHEKAVWAYDYCLLINPEFGAAYFNLGNTYLSQEKFRSAIEQFSKCMEIDGDDPVALCYIGEAYEQLNELSLARMYYQRSIDMAPMMADAWLGMGIVHDLEGKTFEALAFLLKALELDDSNASYYHVLAGAYEKLNEIELADQNYRKSLEMQADDEESLDNYMEMLLETEPLKALDFILSYEKDFGENLRTPLWITNVYWYLGKKMDALCYFRSYFEENPEEALEIFELNPDLKKDRMFKQFLEPEA